jgi:hypothetical protein
LKLAIYEFVECVLLSSLESFVFPAPLQKSKNQNGEIVILPAVLHGCGTYSWKGFSLRAFETTGSGEECFYLTQKK